jgi:O-succinylbenzoic acid--CoA ligase
MQSLASPSQIFQQRLQDEWIVGLDYSAWLARIHEFQQTLQVFTAKGIYPRILLVQSDPLAFLAGLMAACLAECPVFLGNSSWRTSEWQQVLALAQPHLIWDGTGSLPAKVDDPDPSQPLASEKGWIMLPTGGSSGQIRFAIHTWDTLSASVRGCQHHFLGEDGGVIHSCCWLPLYHVSGLMQFMRSLLTGGQLLLLPKQAFAKDTSLDPKVAAFLNPTSLLPQAYFFSLVPTQLQRLLQQDNQRLTWLARFRTVLVGGAPAWPALLQASRRHHLRLAFTYGMTETASQVATSDPDAFLQGRSHSMTVLPHVQITLADEDHQPLPPGHIGQVGIQSAALYKGYYPQSFTKDGLLWTDDLGCLNERGDLTIVGRLSRKIISGGENIYPEEIESALLNTGMVGDAYVLGLPHTEWGESLGAVVVPEPASFSLPDLQAALKKHLSPFKQPQEWIVLPQLPRSPQGKIDRSRLQLVIQAHLQAKNGQYTGKRWVEL